MEHILKTATPNSLIIIDELCRSTNPKEGAQLAWYLCEHLSFIRGLSNNGKYFEEDPGCLMPNVGDESMIESVGNITAVKSSTSSRNSNWKNSKINEITAPFVFLTTHFHSITKLADFHFNVIK